MMRASTPRTAALAAALIAGLLAPGAPPARGAAPARPDSATARPAPVAASRDSVAPPGMVSLTPPPQPPLAQLDARSIGAFRGLFNQDAERTRLLVLVSPSCPFCKLGIEALVPALARDYSNLAIYVVWEHVTRHDRVTPGREVLASFPDPRARQFWDPGRALSDVLIGELPADTLDSVSEKDAAGERVAWDCALIFRPGVRWEDRFPAPDWAGRPIVERMDVFLARLHHLERQRIER